MFVLFQTPRRQAKRRTGTPDSKFDHVKFAHRHAVRWGCPGHPSGSSNHDPPFFSLFSISETHSFIPGEARTAADAARPLKHQLLPACEISERRTEIFGPRTPSNLSLVALSPNKIRPHKPPNPPPSFANCPRPPQIPFKNGRSRQGDQRKDQVQPCVGLYLLYPLLGPRLQLRHSLGRRHGHPKVPRPDLWTDDRCSLHLLGHLHALCPRRPAQEPPPFRLPLRQRGRPAHPGIPLHAVQLLGRQGGFRHQGGLRGRPEEGRSRRGQGRGQGQAGHRQISCILQRKGEGRKGLTRLDDCGEMDKAGYMGAPARDGTVRLPPVRLFQEVHGGLRGPREFAMSPMGCVMKTWQDIPPTSLMSRHSMARKLWHRRAAARRNGSRAVSVPSNLALLFSVAFSETEALNPRGKGEKTSPPRDAPPFDHGQPKKSYNRTANCFWNPGKCDSSVS
ncbi:hypothetical protein CTA2_8898 [Colletotrichum tanaceti]|nr:hypothetical protein CTA2_8898 [Colletotrichum tanaceti]